MTNLKVAWWIAVLILVWCMSSSGQAFDQNPSFEILVSEQSMGVQFSVQGENVAAIKAQLMRLDGRSVFDSGWVTGSGVAWPMVSRSGKPIANGVYLYAVSIRGRDGKEEEQLGKLTIAYRHEPVLSGPRVSEIAESTALLNGAKWQERLGKDGQDNFKILRRPNSSLVYQTLLLLDANGRLGLGTTSPQARLEVVGNGASVLIGDPNCGAGSHTVAIGFLTGASLDCGNNFNFGAGTTNKETVINRPTGGQISFREGNSPDQMTIAPGGNIGIGTNSPGARLDVKGSNGGVAFRVANSNAGNALLVLDNGIVAIGATFSSSTTHACYVSGFFFSACSSAAEYVPTIDIGSGYPETGDLVRILHQTKNPYSDQHGPFVVSKTAKSCDSDLLGFILDPKSGADGKKLNEHYLPLAIYGYFPAKVTMENGPIKRGDPITSSSKLGYGMKATQACKIIGYALEDADKEGMIQVFVHLSEYTAPEVAALRAEVQVLRQQLQQVLVTTQAIRAMEVTK